MRKYLLAAAAIAALSSPAAAQPYLGVEGGILFPKDQDGDVRADFTTTQTPGTPSAGAGPLDTTFNNANSIEYKRGSDIDLIGGYDFGAFRLEGELGRKRARLDEFGVDNGFINALNSALNRPSAAPDPGAPGLAALSGSDLDLGGSVKVRSIMANALLDFGNEDGLSFYAGAGLGRARVRLFGDQDSAWAGQAIAGLRYAVSPNIDVGLKYRYFRTQKINISDGASALQGNRNRTTVGAVIVDQTTNASTFTDFEQKFRSHSLLASLIFNFGSPAPVIVAAPPPPPAPIEVAPATQTCADGSVILATEACPAPAPYVPPAPPEAIPERG